MIWKTNLIKFVIQWSKSDLSHSFQTELEFKNCTDEARAIDKDTM